MPFPVSVITPFSHLLPPAPHSSSDSLPFFCSNQTGDLPHRVEAAILTLTHSLPHSVTVTLSSTHSLIHTLPASPQLTDDVEAPVELADAVAGPPLAHLLYMCPLVEMRVETFHTRQGRDAIIPSHRIHMTLGVETLTYYFKIILVACVLEHSMVIQQIQVITEYISHNKSKYRE